VREWRRFGEVGENLPHPHRFGGAMSVIRTLASIETPLFYGLGSVGGGPLNGRKSFDTGIAKPREMLERQEQLIGTDQQPQAVSGHVGHFNRPREEKEAERSFPKDCWCHASVPCYHRPEV
jgi:hypothetical protein